MALHVITVLVVPPLPLLIQPNVRKKNLSKTFVFSIFLYKKNYLASIFFPTQLCAITNKKSNPPPPPTCYLFPIPHFHSKYEGEPGHIYILIFYQPTAQIQHGHMLYKGQTCLDVRVHHFSLQSLVHYPRCSKALKVQNLSIDGFLLMGGKTSSNILQSCFFYFALTLFRPFM